MSRMSVLHPNDHPVHPPTGTHKGRVSEIGFESRRESRKIEEDDRTGSSVIEEDGMTQVGAVDFLRDEG
jgi:hypothetical protein